MLSMPRVTVSEANRPLLPGGHYEKRRPLNSGRTQRGFFRPVREITKTSHLACSEQDISAEPGSWQACDLGFRYLASVLYRVETRQSLPA